MVAWHDFLLMEGKEECAFSISCILVWHRLLVGVILAAVKPSCPVPTNFFFPNISKSSFSTTLPRIKVNIVFGWFIQYTPKYRLCA